MYRRRRHESPIFILTLLCIGAALTISQAAAAPQERSPARASSPTLLTIRPKPLRADGPEIVNPLRGLYGGAQPAQAARSSARSLPYGSYAWRELEPAHGHYDFSPILRDLAAAKRSGRPYGFRVVAQADGLQLPDYLAAQLEGGRWQGARYLPDWDDPDLLLRAESLLNALGRRFADSPELGFVDVGIYGDRGGWSIPSAEGQPAMSAATRRALIDLYLAAFPGRPLVLPLAAEDDLVYAMGRSPLVGWRQAGLGSAQFAASASMGRLRASPAAWAMLSERWRSAPVLAELSDPQLLQRAEPRQLALSQLREFHVSLLAVDAAQGAGAALIELSAAAGYRYELQEITFPTALSSGGQVTIRSSWRNVGSAPAYQPWDVLLQLRERVGGAVIWEGSSQLRLDRLAGGAEAAPSDEFVLPRALPPGSYDLALLVRDPAADHQPLTLAIAGRQADGSYILGQVELSRPSAFQVLDQQIFLPMVVR